MQFALKYKVVFIDKFAVNNRCFNKLSVPFFFKVAQSVLCNKSSVQSTTYCKIFIAQVMGAGA